MAGNGKWTWLEDGKFLLNMVFSTAMLVYQKVTTSFPHGVFNKQKLPGERFFPGCGAGASLRFEDAIWSETKPIGASHV